MCCQQDTNLSLVRKWLPVGYTVSSLDTLFFIFLIFPHLNQHHRTCLSCPEWGKASWRSDLVELSTQMQNSIHSSLWFYKPVRDLSCASNRSKQDHRSAVKKLPASLAKKQNKCYSHPSWERKMWSTSAPGRSPVAEPYFILRGLTGHSPTLPLNSQSNLNQQPLVCQ